MIKSHKAAGRGKAQQNTLKESSALKGQAGARKQKDRLMVLAACKSHFTYQTAKEVYDGILAPCSRKSCPYYKEVIDESGAA